MHLTLPFKESKVDVTCPQLLPEGLDLGSYLYLDQKCRDGGGRSEKGETLGELWSRGRKR